jgi:hypothetical protein
MNKRFSFIIDFFLGIYNKYPLCCIGAYLVDTIKGYWVSYKRRDDYGRYYRDIPNKEYVPCGKCIKEYWNK